LRGNDEEPRIERTEEPMMRFVRGGVLVVAIGGALCLPACDDPTAPAPITSPPPQTVHGVIARQPIPDFPPDVYLGVPIPLAQAGILDFTVDWTFPDTHMEVAFGTEPCSFQELNARRCPFEIVTSGTTPKPRVMVTQPVPVATYYLYLYSKPWSKVEGTGSDSIESLMLQIGLTVGEGAAPRRVPIEPLRLQPRIISQ
jgi:hypothetical protein